MVQKRRLVVLIPAYNESLSIANVIRSVPRKIPNITDVKVLVMDDHSSDRTAEVSKSAGADFVVKNKQNMGLGSNFKKGIENALKLGADIIVNIDADGQFSPQDIPQLIQPILDEEADMVTCSRFLNKEMTKNIPAAKRWGNRRYAKLVSRITGQKFSDVSCGFRAYTREAALRMNLQGKFTYTQEAFIDLAEKGMRIKEIPLEVRYFKERKSIISGNLRRYGFKSLAIIARATRDTQPLTFFGTPAFFLFLLGFIGGLYSFFFWLATETTTPIRTLFSVSVYFMIFGISLAILALMADMVKTMKNTQDEILYRLKKEELEDGR
jgi:glycosyltransferase involved in cell wall biosynthesis